MNLTFTELIIIMFEKGIKLIGKGEGRGKKPGRGLTEADRNALIQSEYPEGELVIWIRTAASVFADCHSDHIKMEIEKIFLLY